MFNQLMIAKNHVQSFIQSKKGAVAFEYVLIIGTIVVILFGALMVLNTMFRGMNTRMYFKFLGWARGTSLPGLPTPGDADHVNLMPFELE